MAACSVNLEPHSNDDDDAEAKLRERRPTAVNTDELLFLMAVTRTVRRAWILTDSPTISAILRRYPRLADIPQAVCFYPVCALSCWENYVADNVLFNCYSCCLLYTSPSPRD